MADTMMGVVGTKQKDVSNNDEGRRGEQGGTRAGIMMCTEKRIPALIMREQGAATEAFQHRKAKKQRRTIAGTALKLLPRYLRLPDALLERRRRRLQPLALRRLRWRGVRRAAAHRQRRSRCPATLHFHNRNDP